MSYVITEQVRLETIVCGKCGITFAVPQHWKQQRVDNGGGFTCPNGDERIFSEPTVEKLRKELEEKSRALTAAKCEVLAERHVREVAEKKLRRVKNGVCPCCKRSFTNLRRHMETQHKGEMK